jgi:ubiquinone/menaquinone biosynthesis C-methylase UbiE
MHKDEYERMYRYEGDYWWFVGRRELVLSLLKSILPADGERWILDVGCGTGAMVKALQPWGKVVGADLSPLALSFCRKRGCELLIETPAERLPFQSGTFDALTALDLLEHLESDRSALCEFYRVLKPGGWLAISVPAYRFLWSGHDVALMHKRRYTAHLLRDRLLETGFQIEKLSYSVTFLFLPIMLFRLKEKLLGRHRAPAASIIPVPARVNRFLIGVQRFEAKLIRRINLPFGVSVVALVQKPLEQR